MPPVAFTYTCVSLGYPLSPVRVSVVNHCPCWQAFNTSEESVTEPVLCRSGPAHPIWLHNPAIWVGMLVVAPEVSLMKNLFVEPCMTVPLDASVYVPCQPTTAFQSLQVCAWRKEGKENATTNTVAISQS